MRVLGIDFGIKRVGIAIGDDKMKFAFPHRVLTNNVKTISAITALCKKEDILYVVIGESVDYKNKPNPIMKDIEKFKEKLLERIDIPIYYHKETLTTKEAIRLQGKHEKIDSSSAALILLGFFDKNKNDS